jgi:hypothetical protein
VNLVDLLLIVASGVGGIGYGFLIIWITDRIGDAL